MRLRPEHVVFALLLAGASYTVWTQLRTDPVAAYAKKASDAPPIGSVMADATLIDISDQPRRLADMRGAKATVLYFWSVDCPCTEVVEMRIKMAMEKYEARGVEFIGIDGHPDDKKGDIIEKMGRIHSGYRMLLDPLMDAVRKAGVVAATDVVVLDAEGRIRYRGAVDDDLMKPKVPYLHDALDAVLEGKTPAVVEGRSYGCPFPGYSGECNFQ